MKNRFLQLSLFLACISLASLLFNSPVFAQKKATPIEVNGDQVEYLMDGNKLVATGNVSIIQEKTTLTAQRIEFSRDTSEAIAEGNVILKSPQGVIVAEKLHYNFETLKGEFTNVSITAPMENMMGDTGGKSTIYGHSETAAKLSENHIVLKNGYITTCDFRKPHFRMRSKTVDLYPKDKIVARKVKMIVGNQPIMYIPKFTQRLDKKPWLTIIPGYDKQWGMYVLTSMRYYLNDNVSATIHFDAREKKDIASGVDLIYNTKNHGQGSVKTYYMNERSITSKHFYQPRPSPTVEKERFRSEWRHQWVVDEKTDMTLQYSKLSDSTILKDYYEREFEKDSNPQSFFLLTRSFSNGVASFRTDVRVNRFESAVERLPEIRYDITNQQIGNSRVYFKSQNSFVNLNKKEASPTEVRLETMRMDTYNELSYPLKASIFEVRPFVGQRETYYSRTKDTSQYDVTRGIFNTGADLSTKFYKVFDANIDFMGIKADKIRHVITPSAAYSYSHRPTILTSLLDTFDSVDSLDRGHNIHFSLENKLQTKRDDIAVDLLRIVAGTDFHLKENAGKGGFDRVSSDIEFKPADWLTFTSDSDYDTYRDKLSSVNFEAHLKDRGEDGRWTFDIGKRYAPETDDQVTMEWNYKINPKWKFKIYQRVDILHDLLKEQEYTVTRDLHCWEMDINFNETRGSGSEIWIVFRLKAFPDMGLDFGTSFHKRKTGSQSSTGVYD